MTEALMTWLGLWMLNDRPRPGLSQTVSLHRNDVPPDAALEGQSTAILGLVTLGTARQCRQQILNEDSR